MIPRFASVLFSLTLVSPASGQLVDTDDGLVQVEGLVRRTPQDLERLIQEKSPGTTLSSGACAGVLKHELGFPDAAVIRFGGSIAGLPDSLQGPPMTMLLLVEPEDAERVRYLPPPPDSTGPVPEWAEQHARYPMGRLVEPILEHVRPGSASNLPAERPDTLRVLSDLGVAFLEAHAEEEDRRRALDVLRSDRDWINRSIAAAVLTSFPEEETTWWALAEVIRGTGPEDFSTTEGIMALQALGNAHARTIDWTPAAETLRAILDGTNLFAVAPLMQVLTRTEISPALAAEVLGDGRYVLAHLRSPHGSPRHQAQQFLRQARWEEWIASL